MSGKQRAFLTTHGNLEEMSSMAKHVRKIDLLTFFKSSSSNPFISLLQSDRERTEEQDRHKN